MLDPDVVDVPEKVAIVLVAGLEPGPAANVAACIAAGLAARSPGWAGRPLVDATGLNTAASSHLPITVLRADVKAMSALMQKLGAGAENCDVTLFPAYAQTIHTCDEYWQRHSRAVHVHEAMLGIGLSGTKRWVNRLTGSMALWR